MKLNFSGLKIGISSLLLLIVSLFVSGCSDANAEIVGIKNFSFSYSVGCYANGNYSYSVIKTKDGKFIASYKGDGVPEQKASKFPVDETFLIDLEKTLKENNILKWNGFHKSDSNVLDGNGFSFYVRFNDGKSYNASGYESYPKGYREGKNAIENFFQKNMKEKKIKPAKPEY